jgi:hypothetical protein
MQEGGRFCVTNWDDAVDGKEAKTLIEEFKYLPPMLYPDREAYFFPVSEAPRAFTVSFRLAV